LDGWNDFRPRTGLLRREFAIWLRADTIIRVQTHGQKSLDDFLRVFLGQPDTEPIVVPYTREDVEAALSAICPYKLARAF
jgi:predicted metalloprotease with PDZ domain